MAWFGDPGQGGPVDTLLEVKIAVTAVDGGVVDEDAGAGDDASAPTESDAGVVAPDGGAAEDPTQYGGCSVRPGQNATAPWGIGLGVLLVVGMVRRRRAAKRS